MKYLLKALGVAALAIFLSPEAAFAYFSPETIKLVSQSLNPAVIGALVTSLVHLVSAFRHLGRAKKVLVVSVGSIVILAPLAFVFIRVDQLQETNDIANVDLSEDDCWE